MRKHSSKQADGKRSNRVTRGGIKKLLDKEKALFGKMRGPLAIITGECQVLFSMVRDYFTGVYRQVSWRIIAGIAGSLFYVFDPMDMVPDALPGVGLVDDATVVTMCLRAVYHDVQKYKRWKEAIEGERKRNNRLL